MSITRVKFCGMTRARDVEAAVEIGASAVGFVCYPPSPRFVPPESLRDLAQGLPPFVTPVLLFVNATDENIERALQHVPNALLQFHGDETAAQCAQRARPYMRAIRMEDGVDLLDCERQYATSIGLLADTPVEGYGGGGRNFDWARVPPASARTKPLVLAGGLTAANVGLAIAAVRPFAVDVSSGIETSPGIKSVEKMSQFFAAVRAADLAQEAR
ncbi:MAG TPA: phosphoribosylanthranilate isomerase [Burkholderiaceae bacterium]|nr:phosphoribosylanthranilate isomerase [Burkholderiaceae bacterium]